MCNNYIAIYLFCPQKFDLDGDGVVDMEEFLAVCREDADIQRSLVSVHDITIWPGQDTFRSSFPRCVQTVLYNVFIKG